MKRGLVVCLAACLGLLVSAMPVQTGEGLLGYSTWNCVDGRPLGWVRADVVALDPEAKAVAAHELDHVALMRTMSCVEWREAVRDPGFRRMAEARAFCAQSRVAHGEGRFGSVTEAAMEYAGWLAEYDLGLDRADAFIEIMEHCR